MVRKVTKINSGKNEKDYIILSFPCTDSDGRYVKKIKVRKEGDEVDKTESNKVDDEGAAESEKEDDKVVTIWCECACPLDVPEEGGSVECANCNTTTRYDPDLYYDSSDYDLSDY